MYPSYTFTLSLYKGNLIFAYNTRHSITQQAKAVALKLQVQFKNLTFQ